MGFKIVKAFSFCSGRPFSYRWTYLPLMKLACLKCLHGVFISIHFEPVLIKILLIFLDVLKKIPVYKLYFSDICDE